MNNCPVCKFKNIDKDTLNNLYTLVKLEKEYYNKTSRIDLDIELYKHVGELDSNEEFSDTNIFYNLFVGLKWPEITYWTQVPSWIVTLAMDDNVAIRSKNAVKQVKEWIDNEIKKHPKCS